MPTLATLEYGTGGQKDAGLTGALWTNESLWPPTSNQVVQARRIARKLPTELPHVFRILRPTHI